MTVDATGTELMSWSNTGYLDPATTGLYAWTGLNDRPLASIGDFDALMMHEDLPRVYVWPPVCF